VGEFKGGKGEGVEIWVDLGSFSLFVVGCRGVGVEVEGDYFGVVIVKVAVDVLCGNGGSRDG
jgi:hypothetical protein